MKPSKQLIAASVSLLFLIAPAVAQTPGQRIILEQSGSLPRQEGNVRVQTSINIFVPGPTADSADAQKLRDRAQRAVYEMAARECDLLREVLAKDCRMESVSLNLTRQNGQQQFGQQQQEGYNVNGSMNFQITPK
jgi:hypothetical protein